MMIHARKARGAAQPPQTSRLEQMRHTYESQDMGRARRGLRERKKQPRARSGKGGKVLAISMEKQGLKVDRTDGAKSFRVQFHAYYLEHGETPPEGVDAEWWKDAISRHRDWVRNQERQAQIEARAKDNA